MGRGGGEVGGAQPASDCLMGCGSKITPFDSWWYQEMTASDQYAGGAGLPIDWPARDTRSEGAGWKGVH